MVQYFKRPKTVISELFHPNNKNKKETLTWAGAAGKQELGHEMIEIPMNLYSLIMHALKFEFVHCLCA